MGQVTLVVFGSIWGVLEKFGDNSSFKNTFFRVFDVGGQKAQRRKWIHLFDNVNAVLFITSLSDYNETLAEESTMVCLFAPPNSTKFFRIEWSIRSTSSPRSAMSSGSLGRRWSSSWTKSTSSPRKSNTSRLLWLWRITEVVPVENSLWNQSILGKQEYKPSLDYIAKKYRQVNENPDRKIYIHETCATDTKQVEVI